MVCYEFTPLDTLFFRGNTPMEAGQATSESIFPPPVSVVEGAVRTALMKQNGIALNKENGEKINVQVTAILVKKSGKFYVPAPATWYAECPKDGDKKSDNNKHFVGMKIIDAKPLEKTVADALGIKSSERDVPFVTESTGTEAKALGANWVSFDLLCSGKSKVEKDDVLLASDIYMSEARTGIGLDENKHTEKGKLYTASHIRLKDDASLVFCLNEEPKFDGKKFAESGTIQLGGEQRLCRYKKIKDENCPKLPSDSKGNYVCLAPVEATQENLEKIISSGKLKVVSGWDLATGFHKPSSSWIPAGAVFSEKINGSCFALADRK